MGIGNHKGLLGLHSLGEGEEAEEDGQDEKSQLHDGQ